MPDRPTGTVTFLFTDIEGSTRLLQQLGDEYARALGEHQALVRAAWADHGGVEIDTAGDGFFVAFPAAPQAVAAAAQATRALAAHTWPEETTLRVRIGVHTGTPQLVGDRYVGLDVHHAARVMAAGHGGQVVLSQATRDLAAPNLPADTTLRELGLYRLKDLRQPERLYQLIMPGLPAEFPPLKTLDLRPHNLPVQPTPLLGREEQLAALGALLRGDDVRLVTLTGPGGIGKTRLAVQLAAELVEAFPDGVWFVRLSRLTDPELVIPTIAQTFGLKEAGSQPIAEVLRDYVAGKRLLLVLDNFEQVVGAAPEVAALMETSAGVKVLATSRVPLRLRGERSQPVPPLPLARQGELPPVERFTEYAAVALFIQRARDAKPDFVVSANNAPAIAAICAELDGLPLAIELAAARVKLLPPEALLARLSSQLKLLTGGARDLEERQQTIRATLKWSENLLTPSERVLLRRLAVFVGGATLEAAEAVCAAPDGAAPLDTDVLEGLAELVDQSLVQQREEGGEARFGMLHVIREYALEQLEAVGASDGSMPSGKHPEAEALGRAHGGYFTTLAERAQPELTGPEQGAWLDKLEREHDNLRATIRWAREHGAAEMGLQLVAALPGFWRARGHLREGRAWAEDMLGLAAGQETGDADLAPSGDRSSTRANLEMLRARTLVAGGALAVWQEDQATAVLWLEQAASLGHAAGDLRTVGRALMSLGILARHRGDLDRAATCNAEALALARQLDDRRGIAASLGNLGNVANDQGDLERAEAYYTEALALHRQGGDTEGIAICLGNLGQTVLRRGEVARADALAREALALFWEVGDEHRCAEGLERLGITARALGQNERAARLLGAALARREIVGAPQPANERVEVEQAAAAARTALGEAAWAAVFAAGQALPLEQAVADALSEHKEDSHG
jgi:predicted ATPase/class 3 adenylate cyclase